MRTLIIIFVICTPDTIYSIKTLNKKTQNLNKLTTKKPTTKQNQKKHPQKTKPTHRRTQPTKKSKAHADTTHPIFFVPTHVCLDINFRTNRNNLSNFTYFFITVNSISMLVVLSLKHKHLEFGYLSYSSHSY